MLPPDFYQTDGITVAKNLLGKLLVLRAPEGEIAGKIVETEAYMGEIDAAAHSYKAPREGRTNIQYGAGGRAYIYMIYGMHYCFNVVANRPGVPEAVLVRALEPVAGLDLMRRNRGTEKLKNLTNGPGKLCRALGITNEHYGADLCAEPLFITEFETAAGEDIIAAPRVNVDYAGEAKDYLWRFYLRGNGFVSKI